MNSKYLRVLWQLVLIVLWSSSGSAVAADSLHDHPPILQSASEMAYPPFAIVKADGTADGFSVELLKAVVEAVDMQVNVAVGPWHFIKKQLATGRLDVLPLVSYSSERDKVFDFTVPYLQMHGAIFVRRGEQSIVDGTDLKDKEVLVMRDDTAHEYAVRHKLSTKLILTSTFEEAMQLLSAGKHDAVFCQYVMGLQLIKQLGIKNIVSLSAKDETSLRPREGTITGFEQKFCMAVPEGRKKLLAQLNEGLAIVSANGRYDAIYRKWFGPILPAPALSFKEMIKYFLFIGIPILLLLAAIGVYSLKREVARQTRQLKLEIQERKQAEETIKKSERLLAETSRIGKVGGWEFNIDTRKQTWTDETYRIHEVDYSYDPSAQNGAKFYTPASLPVINKAVREVIKYGRPFDLELEIITGKGNHRYSHVVGKPDLENRRVYGFMQDITKTRQAENEKRLLESQLRQSQKMEALGTLAGGIAHDFNNLLAAILGYADMALEDTSPASPAKYQIEQVVKAGNRAKELVKQILAFSRKETHPVSTIQPHLVVQEALNLLRASIPSSIQIQQNIDEKSGTILADPTQIHQIILNLCTNATQAMRLKKGILRVSVTTVLLDAAALAGELNFLPGSYVHLMIADDGIGIDKDHIEKIFDPYFTTKEIGKGSGMGLAVVAGIVKSSNGLIKVDSTPEKGTTFHVYFPRCTEKTPEEHQETGPVPSGNEKILVVDDEESVAVMTRIMVERLGYQATSVTSSVDALALFRAQPDAFDLVITDQTMPKMTGEQLVVNLREVRPRLPIILCTGNSSKINQKEAQDIAASLFLMKPVPIRELAQAIRQMLDTRSTL